MSFSIHASTAESLGPAFFPRVVAFCMAALSIGLIFKNIKALQKAKGKVETVTEKKPFKMNYSLLFSALLLIAYMILVNTIGFIIMSIIYIFCQIILISAKEDLNKKYYIIYAVVAVVTPIVLYYVFYNFLGVFLPTGILG
jgi:putative tricarboxylic transport membrane protein